MECRIGMRVLEWDWKVNNGIEEIGYYNKGKGGPCILEAHLL